MLTQNEKDALNIACEMERRGIMIYRRAQMLAKDENVIALLKRLEGDEFTHLGQFSAMAEGISPEEDLGEKRVLLAAYAQKALLKGGVMELVRDEALQSAKKLIAHAIGDELAAVETYREYSAQSEDPKVKAAFLLISREEEKHLASLEEISSQMD